MRQVLFILLIISSLYAERLVLTSGFVAAHTEAFGTEDINPLSPVLKADVHYFGTIESLKGTISADLAFFSSENKYRDESMSKTLEVDQTSWVDFKILSLEKSDYPVYKLKGVLTLHQVEKEIVFDVHIQDTPEMLILRGEGEILMSDFKISSPSFLFLQVRDRVDLYVQAIFLK